MMKRLILALFAFGLFAAVPAAAQTVILVRHAEKADASADPVLSEAGQDRARQLATVLADAGLTHVLVTTLQRTALTAAPSADQAGLAPEAIDVRGGAEHITRVAARVRELPQDAVVLIVGHSNTVPLIARALGFTDAADMADCEYDRLTVLDLRVDASPAIVSRYGLVSACE